MTISKDRVKPSPRPDSWKLPEIFATGVVIGTYLALITVLFYWIVIDTTFFEASRLKPPFQSYISFAISKKATYGSFFYRTISG